MATESSSGTLADAVKKAAAQGDVAELRRLRVGEAGGEPVDATDREGRTALHYAAGILRRRYCTTKSASSFHVSTFNAFLSHVNYSHNQQQQQQQQQQLAVSAASPEIIAMYIVSGYFRTHARCCVSQRQRARG